MWKRVPLEDFEQRILERVGAIGIEQLQEARGVAAEMLAAVGQAAEECRAARRRLGEAIQPAVLSGLLLKARLPSDGGSAAG